jgi:hypothetical protein
MRHFQDQGGTTWDVVLGRESWGASVALFVPPAASGKPVRQTQLAAVAHDQAAPDQESMDEAARPARGLVLALPVAGRLGVRDRGELCGGDRHAGRGRWHEPGDTGAPRLAAEHDVPRRAALIL